MYVRGQCEVSERPSSESPWEGISIGEAFTGSAIPAMTDAGASISIDGEHIDAHTPSAQKTEKLRSATSAATERKRIFMRPKLTVGAARSNALPRRSAPFTCAAVSAGGSTRGCGGPDSRQVSPHKGRHLGTPPVIAASAARGAAPPCDFRRCGTTDQEADHSAAARCSRALRCPYGVRPRGFTTESVVVTSDTTSAAPASAASCTLIPR